MEREIKIPITIGEMKLDEILVKVEKKEEQLTYVPKTEEEKIAIEVIDFLRPKELPLWQVKEILAKASNMAELEKLK